MSKLLVSAFGLSLSVATAAHALSIDVPGVSIRTDAKGNVVVDAPGADVVVDGRTVHNGGVATRGSAPTAKGAVVNAASAGSRSVQVVNGGADGLCSSVVVEGSVVNAAGPGGSAEQVINGRRSVVAGRGTKRRGGCDGE